MKRLSLLSILIIVLLLMAACGGAPATEAPAPAEEPAEEPTAAPVEEEAAEPAAEEATEAPEVAADSSETVKIGGIHPLTGGLAADGIQMDTAIQMAIEEINAAGGVLGGAQLEYLSADSTGSPEVGQTEAERLVSEGADALICCF